MGMDFVAFLKCRLTPNQINRSLELVNSLKEIQEFELLWNQNSFIEKYERGSWVNNSTEGEMVEFAPVLPTIEFAYRTKAGFCLTYGDDIIRIYHPLRWLKFLQEAIWQSRIISACQAFASLYNATDGILTSDWSPINEEFFEGASFDQALEKAIDNEGEVSKINQLYRELPNGGWESHGYWRFI